MSLPHQTTLLLTCTLSSTPDTTDTTRLPEESPVTWVYYVADGIEKRSSSVEQWKNSKVLVSKKLPNWWKELSCLSKRSSFKACCKVYLNWEISESSRSLWLHKRISVTSVLSIFYFDFKSCLTPRLLNLAAYSLCPEKPNSRTFSNQATTSLGGNIIVGWFLINLIYKYIS